jgi:glycosyltransferase involved in cell wall biosynthesis
MSAEPIPRVSVVVPCYNDGPLAKEAVESLSEEEPIEVVVVDDCSTEPKTAEALAELDRRGTTIVRHGDNRGLSAARNTGLRATAAPYVFPLDADDLLVPGALERMADRLDEAADAAACVGNYVEFGEHSAKRRVPPVLDAYRLAYRNEYPASALFRRSALEEIGGWRWGLGAYEDWDVWLSFAERDFSCVHAGEAPIFRRRVHTGRMLVERGRRGHRHLYRELRRNHPAIYQHLREHRRSSSASLGERLTYPVLYGGRPRGSFDLRVKRLLDRIRARASSWATRSG